MSQRLPEKIVLYVCANANQVNILAPVVRCLDSQAAARGDTARGVMLSLDQYYGQHAGGELERLEFPWLELPGRICAGRFYDRLDQRDSFVAEAAIEVDYLLPQLSGLQCVVLGHDVEYCEQFIIRAAERLGIPTVRVQDGTDFGVEIELGDRLENSRYPFDGGCDLNITWAEGTVRRLQQRGVPGEIAAVGNLRLDPYVTESFPTDPQPKGPPWRVLLCLQCFCRHHHMSLAQEAAMYESLIRKFLSRRDVVVEVKLHPHQQHPEVYYRMIESFGDRVSLCREPDSVAALRNCSLVAAVASTVLTEATLLGLPAMSLVHALEKDSRRFLDIERDFLAALHAPGFPLQTHFRLPDRTECIREQGGVVDGKAAQRAASAIGALIARKRAAKAPGVVPAAAPVASVVLLHSGGDALGTLRSVLRTDAAGLEVVVVDTTAEGSARSVSTQLSEKNRVEVIHMPGAAQGDALNAAVAACRAEIVLRCAQNCTAFSGWPASTIAELEANPEASFVSSWYRYRDAIGAIWWMRVLKPKQTAAVFASLEDAGAFLQAYGFRRSAYSPLPAGSTDADSGFVSMLLSRAGGQFPVAIVQKCLFATPFDRSVYAQIGRPPSGGVLEVRQGRGETSARPPASSHSETAAAAVVTPRYSVLIGGSAGDGQRQDLRERRESADQAVEFVYCRSAGQPAEAGGGILTQVKAGLESAGADRLLLLPGEAAPDGESLARLFSEFAPGARLLQRGAARRSPRSDLLDLALAGDSYFERGALHIAAAAAVLAEIFAAELPPLCSWWGVTEWIFVRCQMLGIEINDCEGAFPSGERTFTLEQFLCEEILRRRDQATLAAHDPAFSKKFFGAELVAGEQLQNWREQVSQAGSQIALALGEIEKTRQDVRRYVEAGGDPTAFSQLVAPVMEILKDISLHIQQREIVRQCLHMPDFAAIEFGGRRF